MIFCHIQLFVQNDPIWYIYSYLVPGLPLSLKVNFLMSLQYIHFTISFKQLCGQTKISGRAKLKNFQTGGTKRYTHPFLLHFSIFCRFLKSWGGNCPLIPSPGHATAFKPCMYASMESMAGTNQIFLFELMVTPQSDLKTDKKSEQKLCLPAWKFITLSPLSQLIMIRRYTRIG